MRLIQHKGVLNSKFKYPLCINRNVLNKYLNVGNTVEIISYLEFPGQKEKNDKEKERVQSLYGVIIATYFQKNSIKATITVRKMFQETGVDKVIRIHSPWIKSIKAINFAKVKRSKLYYLRKKSGKSSRLKKGK